MVVDMAVVLQETTLTQVHLDQHSIGHMQSQDQEALSLIKENSITQTVQIMATIELNHYSTHIQSILSYQLEESSQQMVTIMMPGQAYIFSKA